MVDDGFSYEYFGERSYYHDWHTCCPDCGSEDIEEASRCEVCGEPVRSGKDYCENCVKTAKDAICDLAHQLGKDYDATLDLIWSVVEAAG